MRFAFRGIMKKRTYLLSTGLLAVFLTLTLSGCGLHSLHMQQSPLLKYFVPKSGHIAFVGIDGNIHISDQSGNVVDVTTDGQVGSTAKVSYGAPTWSFDGKQIVYPRFQVDSKNKTQMTAVYTANLSGKDPHEVFSSAALAPFYFYWSPNDKEIGMLSQVLATPGSIEMGIIPATPQSPVADYHVINSDAPFYWVWSPGGESLIAHTQTGSAQDAPDYVRVIPATGNPKDFTQLKANLGAFDTPAIAEGGHEIVLPIGTSDASDLMVRNLQTGKERLLAKALGSVSYSLSPNGKWLAYIDQADSKDTSSRALHIVNMSDPRNSYEVKERPVFTFYWSPNSREIAYIVPPQSQSPVDPMFANNAKLPYAELQVINVSRRNSWSIAQFPITQAFLNQVPFNDQYQHSTTIWSPNSKYLVFSAYDAPGNPGIFVSEADGNIKPDLIASGEFPAWSWK